MSKRGICQTRFYGAKETSDSSVCSTSEDDIFERSDIVIPPTDMSDETGSSFDGDPETKSSGQWDAAATVLVPESLVVTQDEVLPSVCHNSTTTAVSAAVRASESLVVQSNAASSGVNVIQAEASPILLQKCTSSSVSSSAFSAPIRLLEKIAVPDFLSSMALPQDDSLIGSRSPKQANIFSTSTPLSDKNKAASSGGHVIQQAEASPIPLLKCGSSSVLSKVNSSQQDSSNVHDSSAIASVRPILDKFAATSKPACDENRVKKRKQKQETGSSTTKHLKKHTEESLPSNKNLVTRETKASKNLTKPKVVASKNITKMLKVNLKQVTRSVQRE